MCTMEICEQTQFRQIPYHDFHTTQRIKVKNTFFFSNQIFRQ